MSSSSAHAASGRLAYFAHHLREAHDRQRRECQLLEQRYHAVRQSTNELNRHWSLYCKELERQLGVPHWSAIPSGFSSEATGLEVMQGFPGLSTWPEQSLSHIGEHSRTRSDHLYSGNNQYQGSIGPVEASYNNRSVRFKLPPMDPNPSPFVRSSRSRERFRATGSQHSQQQRGPSHNHHTRSQSAPAPKRMVSREQLLAMHNQHSEGPKPSSNRTITTAEPRCIVPDPPHERRGIRFTQSRPLPPIPVRVRDTPPVPPLPHTHFQRQRPDVQGRPKNLTMIDVSDQTHVRVYSPQGPYGHSPMECDGNTLQPRMVYIPGRTRDPESVNPRESISPSRTRLQKKRRDESP